MKTGETNMDSVQITPPVHLEFIHNQLENPQGSAQEEVESYHRALFLHQHAVEREKFREQAQTHQERLAFLEGRLKNVQLWLNERTKLMPVEVDGQEDTKPSAPWNGWDLAMFVTCSLGIVCLITFGIMNISFNLLESGFITFRENPFRSYLWAALLPVGALGVKIGWDFLRIPKRRDIYLWSCLALGMLGVILWVGAYACVYPTLSKGINEQIAALTVFDNPSGGSTSVARMNFAGAKWIDVITVGAQAMAEIFLSAVLGMYLTNLYARHRPVRLVHDPAYAQLESERRELEASIAEERASLGQANGNLLRLENQLTALIAYGKSLLHRESAKRQDHSEKRQVILDQLSEHLRHHLEAPGPGNRLNANALVSSNRPGNGE